MRYVYSSAALILTASLPLLVYAADRPPAPTDQDRLQGTWVMVSGNADGQELPAALAAKSVRVCKGDETTVTLNSMPFLHAKFTLDPSKTPKAVDYLVLDGPQKGQKLLGIYALDGDTAKFCFSAPGAQRPADFAPGPARSSSVWRRDAQHPTTRPE